MRRRRYILRRKRTLTLGVETKTITEEFNLLDGFQPADENLEPFPTLTRDGLSSLTDSQYENRVYEFLKLHVGLPNQRELLLDTAEFTR